MHAVRAYDLSKILIDCIERSTDVEYDLIKKQLINKEYELGMGKIYVDKFGDTNIDYAIYNFKDGQFNLIN